MSDPNLRQLTEAAIARLAGVLDAQSPIRHEDLREAVDAVVRVRNRAIETFRAGALDHQHLQRSNAVLSAAFGAEFPLIGLHLERLRMARGGLEQLLDA